MITASENGPRFSVRDATGSVTAQRLSETELSERFGELHRIYRSAVAREADAPFLDATAERFPAADVQGRPAAPALRP